MLRNTGRVEFEYSVFGAEGGAGPPPLGQVTVHPTSVSKVCWVSGCYWCRVCCVWVLLVESGLCVGVTGGEWAVCGCYWWRVGCVWVLLVESGLCVCMHIAWNVVMWR